MTTPAPRPDGFRSDAHRALAEREQLIAQHHQVRGQDAVFEAIAADRASRWAALLKDREESAEIRSWAANMMLLFGSPDRPQPFVRSYRTVVPWITALYIARYGEAEDHWPAALTHEDWLRAQHWLEGKYKPDGVVYLPREAA
jgi:hypothetical protein